MKNFLINLSDWIYKKKCYFCRSSKESVKMCSSCFDELEFLPVEVNRQYRKVNIYCAGFYTKNLQKMIRGLKYHRQSDLAYYQAKFMWQYWQRLNPEGEYVIIPVPVFPARKKKRKYNHMELVAEEFAKLSGFETNFSLIKRIKDTKPQYKLNKSQRMQNLANAFEVNEKVDLKNKKLLVIDDICTTGSTFEQIINELNNYGIKDITCFAAATPLYGN